MISSAVASLSQVPEALIHSVSPSFSEVVAACRLGQMRGAPMLADSERNAVSSCASAVSVIAHVLRQHDRMIDGSSAAGTTHWLLVHVLQCEQTSSTMIESGQRSLQSDAT
jgi:hypothetical protein